MRGKAEDGTEGSWNNVMRLIGQAHYMLHKKGIVRIQTDIRVGSRYDSSNNALGPTKAHTFTGQISCRNSAKK